MLGFEALTPNAPIVPPKYLSAAAAQVLPPSVDLNTPPPVVPIQYSRGRAAEPATATVRPPRKMPISRQVSPVNTVLSYAACPRAMPGRASNATTRATDRRRWYTGTSGTGKYGTGEDIHRSISCPAHVVPMTVLRDERTPPCSALSRRRPGSS